MPLVTLAEIIKPARVGRYGVLSLLAGSLEMVTGAVRAAEDRRAPLILAFNQEMTPGVPMELGLPMVVNAARQARVPVATILDHGADLESVVVAIRAGTSAVMFDGSRLPYDENVARTAQVARLAHAAGVSVEGELGSIAGEAFDPSQSGPLGTLTDPGLAAEFVARTGIDALAISVGNAHGVYRGEPHLDLDRVRAIHACVDVPLVMHGASGLADGDYARLVAAGISKVCYYTAMGLAAVADLRGWLAAHEPGSLVYHHVITRMTDFFYNETRRLIDLVGSTGQA